MSPSITLFTAVAILKRNLVVSQGILGYVCHSKLWKPSRFTWWPWLVPCIALQLRHPGCKWFEFWFAEFVDTSVILCPRLATLNGAVGSVHYSFGIILWFLSTQFDWFWKRFFKNGATLRWTGRGLGSFIGGILMANYGTRNAFQIFGTGAGLAGVTYFLLHRLYLVQMERLRLRRKSGNYVISPWLFNATHFHIRIYYAERIASIIASGEEVDDEPEEEYIIPPDNLLGRRKSCF